MVFQTTHHKSLDKMDPNQYHKICKIKNELFHFLNNSVAGVKYIEGRKRSDIAGEIACFYTSHFYGLH